MTTLKPLAKNLTGSIRSFRSRSSSRNNNGYFSNFDDAHHLTRLKLSSQVPRADCKTPSSPTTENGAEVHGPVRYAATTKGDHSRFSEWDVNGIKTKKAIHVTNEEYDPFGGEP